MSFEAKLKAYVKGVQSPELAIEKTLNFIDKVIENKKPKFDEIEIAEAIMCLKDILPKLNDKQKQHAKLQIKKLSHMENDKLCNVSLWELLKYCWSKKRK